MVTGDHARTALAVAREVGIVPAGEGGAGSGIVVSGSELDEISDIELAKRLGKVKVFARVEPRHKLRIVNAYQGAGEVIGMTGDGVNDAPALKKADIGIALGSGTDVAKETSDLILLDDKFSIIPEAVREGRILVDNIRKVITYLLSSAFSEVILISASIVAGLPLPVTAVQILWVNVVEDALPGIAFTFERGASDVMKRKPEPKNKPLLNGEMRKIIVTITLVANATLFILFMWLLSMDYYSIEHVRTFVFAALGIDSLMFVFACRDLNKNIWHYNPFSNIYMVGAVVLGFVFMFAVVYVPALQKVFDTVSLDPFDWVLLAGFGILNLVLIEAIKFVTCRKKQ